MLQQSKDSFLRDSMFLWWRPLDNLTTYLVGVLTELYCPRKYIESKSWRGFLFNFYLAICTFKQRWRCSQGLVQTEMYRTCLSVATTNEHVTTSHYEDDYENYCKLEILMMTYCKMAAMVRLSYQHRHHVKVLIVKMKMKLNLKNLPLEEGNQPRWIPRLENCSI